MRLKNIGTPTQETRDVWMKQPLYLIYGPPVSIHGV